MGFMEKSPEPEKLLRYIGRLSAVSIAEAPSAGTVAHGATVLVEGSLADRLLEQPANWELAESSPVEPFDDPVSIPEETNDSVDTPDEETETDEEAVVADEAKE